jgi:hypothetical protein
MIFGRLNPFWFLFDSPSQKEQIKIHAKTDNKSKILFFKTRIYKNIPSRTLLSIKKRSTS